MSNRILHREIAALQQQMLELAALAEQNLQHAVNAVETRDVELAQQVLTAEKEVDRLEVELEEECLKVLALHQPVAIDLRQVIAVLKINNDLERVADLASTIAKRAKTLAELPGFEAPFDLHAIAEKAWSLVHQSLDALVRSDLRLAQQVRDGDKEVDKLNRRNLKLVRKAIIANPESTEAQLCYFWVSRSLERVADHATNIAEDVIYTLSGEIVRHVKGLPASVQDESDEETP